jgi:CzcA family heavy metal efflux pump
VIGALVRFSVLRPWLVLVLAVACLFFGVHRLAQAPLEVFPEFSPAQVVIQTEAPGLSAELVEVLVTQPIEAALSGTTGVRALRSQSIPGLSVVTVIFDERSDLFRNRQLVAERAASLATQLPRGVSLVITPLTSSASTVLTVGLTSAERSLTELRTLADWTLRPHLMSVDGVADVNVFGGRVEQWEIQLVPEKLAAAGVSLREVLAAATRATGVRGAGFIDNGTQRIIVASEAHAPGPESLAQAVVARRAGHVVTLGDVAQLAAGSAPSISGAQIDTQPGVMLMVQGQLGGNVYQVTQALEAALREMMPLLERERVRLHPGLFRPANFIETALGNVRQDILVGSALVVAILFLFLFNARSAFISALAIPLSLISAAAVLGLFGFTINIMVLGGLAIALGEVVDDAIIDTENVYRRLRENRATGAALPGWHVVLTASLEVRSSVVYATFIVALVFVPLLTLGGVAGKLFAPLGLAYILAILASLVVALTVTPALSCLLLARGELGVAEPPLIARMKSAYVRLLRAVEQHAAAVMTSVALAVMAMLAVLPLLAAEFIPHLKEGHYIIHMSAVPGTSEAETLRLGTRVTEAVLKIPGVQSVAQWVGRAQNGADTFGVHYSEFEVELQARSGAEQDVILRSIRKLLAGDDGDADRSDEEREGARRRFLGVNFAVNTFLTERIEETVSGYTAPLVAQVFGASLDRLDRDAQEVARTLVRVSGAHDVQLQTQPGNPQFAVRLRPDRIAELGLNHAEVIEAVEAATAGTQVGQIYRESRVIRLAATLEPQARRHPAQLAGLLLRGPGGELVRLDQLAEIHPDEGRYKILREGGKRVQTVTANIRGRDYGDFVEDVRQALGKVRLSPGNYLKLSGTAIVRDEASRELIIEALLAGVGVLLLLLLAFNSVRNLALTLVNLPFALVGGVIAAMATGATLSLGSLVGFVTLFGITLRNSIMLVSHYQHLVEVDGMPWNLDTAIRGASERLPSILMTALVTAIGLLPLALGSGEPGREIEGPMATIIVGGLLTSTVLNLLVLPAVLLRFGHFAPPVATRDGAPAK